MENLESKKVIGKEEALKLISGYRDMAMGMSADREEASRIQATIVDLEKGILTPEEAVSAAYKYLTERQEQNSPGTGNE